MILRRVSRRTIKKKSNIQSSCSSAMVGRLLLSEIDLEEGDSCPVLLEERSWMITMSSSSSSFSSKARSSKLSSDGQLIRWSLRKLRKFVSLSRQRPPKLSTSTPSEQRAKICCMERDDQNDDEIFCSLPAIFGHFEPGYKCGGCMWSKWPHHVWS